MDEPEDAEEGIDGIHTVDAAFDDLTIAQRSLEISLPAIVTWFDSQDSSVYSHREVLTILREHKSEWRLRGYLPPRRFVEFLLERTPLKSATLESPNYRGIERFTWRDASVFEVAASLRAGSYFSHSTAMHLHGLDSTMPTRVYVNREQSAKPAPRNKPTNESIRQAFSRPQRVSRYDFKHAGHFITILSGKHTGRYGVIEMRGPHGRLVDTTNLERTLVDCVVRPSYAGGVPQVQAAFNTAVGRLSIEVMIATLKALAHAYPYHQSIGFYLERAGAEKPVLDRLRKLKLKCDFYLDYGMRATDYDSNWRVYYPSEEWSEK